MKKGYTGLNDLLIRLDQLGSAMTKLTASRDWWRDRGAYDVLYRNLNSELELRHDQVIGLVDKMLKGGTLTDEDFQ